MKTAKYTDAIDWIAFNDEVLQDDDDVRTISKMTSVMIVADIFGKSYEHVAFDVLKKRLELIGVPPDV